MSWISSIVVALIAAAAGLFASGFVAQLYTGWYRVSNFEGGAAYLVVYLALFGGVVALIVGIVTSRAIAGGANPSFARALLMSLAIVVGTNAAIGGVAYLAADIAPKIDGEALHLAFELEWPTSQQVDPRSGAAIPRAWIGAGAGGTVRKRWDGVFLLDGAHRGDDDRWVASGIVPIETTRGRRLLGLDLGERPLAAFDVPLPAKPGAQELEWSEWLPRARDGNTALPDGFRYRFKVLKRSQPWRIDTIGPFTVETSSSGFVFQGSEGGTTASSIFRVFLKGELLPEGDSVRAVMVASRNPPALVVSAPEVAGPAQASRLLVADVDSLRTEVLSEGPDLDVVSLARLPSSIVDANGRRGGSGFLDTRTLGEPGLYLFRESVVDTRTLKAMPLVTPDSMRPDASPGILALSPDERSVVWTAKDAVSLGVTDFVAGTSYLRKVDLDRMRLTEWGAIDPAWVFHHFEWKREGGKDVLEERASFTPMPYRGSASIGAKGEYQSWQVAGVDRTMEAAVVGILVQALGGRVLPPDPTTVGQVVQVGDQTVTVMWFDSGPYVNVAQYNGDPGFMRRVATVLDSALATGKHDEHFIR